MSAQATYVSGRFPRVERASIPERVTFIRRTYRHLAASIVVFVFLEAILVKSGVAVLYLDFVFAASTNWLIILGLFMFTGYLAHKWARNDRSRLVQYLGLALYVSAEAFLFLPLLAIAALFSSPLVVSSAGLVTLITFGGLSATVLLTKEDFLLLQMGLSLAGLLTLGLILAAILFGTNLGVLFSIALVGLASGYILYYTSNVVHRYRTDQYVAASLSLFASVALLFWYVLRLYLLTYGED
ncbi:MAG: Bax inhibitor-1 family protein [Candidatus Promineifilaceae bacterium]|nr:Bax inhibitor-1 family protein [Candidatus Promineifilaceae bacterium]